MTFRQYGLYKEKNISTALWTVQILLAIVFLLHGYLFVAMPPSMVKRRQLRRPDAEPAFPPWFRIFIGVVEILVAIGLNLPGLTGILTWLTPLAAAGLMIVMIGVVILHLKHQEWTSMIGSGVILLLVTFVAYGRFFVVPYSDWAQIRLD